MTGADIILLDEPTAHLDAPSGRALLEELREGLADRTVILVTHNAADISDDDDRLVLTGAGQPAQSEPVPVA
jgi:ATP-binding cassette subfamily C protein CydCD